MNPNPVLHAHTRKGEPPAETILDVTDDNETPEWDKWFSFRNCETDQLVKVYFYRKEICVLEEGWTLRVETREDVLKRESEK